MKEKISLLLNSKKKLLFIFIFLILVCIAVVTVIILLTRQTVDQNKAAVGAKSFVQYGFNQNTSDGSIDIAQCDNVMGWVQIKSGTTRSQTSVSFWATRNPENFDPVNTSGKATNNYPAGVYYLGETVANQARPELSYPGNYGFAFQLPRSVPGLGDINQDIYIAAFPPSGTPGVPAWRQPLRITAAFGAPDGYPNGYDDWPVANNIIGAGGGVFIEWNVATRLNCHRGTSAQQFREYIDGSLDVANTCNIYGWVWNRKVPAAKTKVAIFLDEPIFNPDGQLKNPFPTAYLILDANLPRPDLASRAQSGDLGGDSSRGFKITNDLLLQTKGVTLSSLANRAVFVYGIDDTMAFGPGIQYIPIRATKNQGLQSDGGRGRTVDNPYRIADNQKISADGTYIYPPLLSFLDTGCGTPPSNFTGDMSCTTDLSFVNTTINANWTNYPATATSANICALQSNSTWGLFGQSSQLPNGSFSKAGGSGTYGYSRDPNCTDIFAQYTVSCPIPPTATPSFTPTQTFTQTSTPTTEVTSIVPNTTSPPMDTPTYTPSYTPTDTVTFTPTSTYTETATLIPSNTATPTFTVTDTFIPTTTVSTNLTCNKYVYDINGDQLVPGEILEYIVEVRNNSLSAINQVVLNDSIPNNTTYISSSLRILSGSNGGLKTDILGDDQGENTGTQVIFRLGQGANATDGGSLLPGESAKISFRVQVMQNVAVDTAITNQANISGADISRNYSSSCNANIVVATITPPKTGLLDTLLVTILLGGILVFTGVFMLIRKNAK